MRKTLIVILILLIGLSFIPQTSFAKDNENGKDSDNHIRVSVVQQKENGEEVNESTTSANKVIKFLDDKINASESSEKENVSQSPKSNLESKAKKVMVVVIESLKSFVWRLFHSLIPEKR